ncbi:MAG TPA: hypothetical protein VMY05_11365 [Acidobacteriota bacterium]|nr:hypothetical protein [Acidobacteriota bacterium]
MDVLNDRIIDVGLNAVGYIAAGLLWMLVYSAFAGRRKTSPAAGRFRPDVAVKAAHTSGDTSPQDGKQVEFINFGRSHSAGAAGQRADGDSVGVSPASARRDRADIIRIARQMLKAGAPQDTIKRTLPISDGELALLNQGRP